jgi:O-antigen/teichoic acid export membrane protein
MILKRIVKGFGENTVDRIINIVIRFLEPVIFIAFSSLSFYGSWIIIFSLPAYIMMSDMGFSTIGQNQINMNIKKKSFLDAQCNFNNTLSALVLLNFFFSIIYFLFFSSIFKAGFLKIDSVNLNQFNQIIFLVILYSFLHQVSGLFTSIYAAHNKYHIKVRIGYFGRFLEFCALLLCLRTNQDYILILVSFISLKIVFIISVYAHTRKKYSWIKIRFKLEKKYIKKNFLLASSYLLFPLTNAIRFQTTNLLVGIFLGSNYVAILSVYLTISRIPISLSSIADGILRLELAKLWIANKFKTLLKIFLFNFQITLTLSIFFIFFIVVFNQFIFKIWVGENFYKNHFLLLILLFYGMFQSLFLSSINFQISTNNFKKISFYNFVICLLSTLLIAILTNKHGLIAVALIYAFSEIILMLISLKIASKYGKFNLHVFFINLFNLKKFIKNIKNIA